MLYYHFYSWYYGSCRVIAVYGALHISEFSARITESTREGQLVGKYGAASEIEREEMELRPHLTERKTVYRGVLRR